MSVGKFLAGFIVGGAVGALTVFCLRRNQVKKQESCYVMRQKTFAKNRQKQ